MRPIEGVVIRGRQSCDTNDTKSVASDIGTILTGVMVAELPQVR